MPQSTLTEKGQTTVRVEVRKAMNLKPQQQLIWEVQTDGATIVRPQPSALDLFDSLKPKKKFPGTKKEKEAVRKAAANQAANEGLDSMSLGLDQPIL